MRNIDRLRLSRQIGMILIFVVVVGAITVGTYFLIIATINSLTPENIGSFIKRVREAAQ